MADGAMAGAGGAAAGQEGAPRVGARAATPWIRVGLASDSGRARSDNQDAVFALAASLPPQFPGGKGMPFGVFAVADGMGGLSDGAVASNTAIRLVAGKVLGALLAATLNSPDGGEPPIVADLLRSALEDTSNTIFSVARSAGLRSGTTLSLALVLGRQLTLAHAGDSRIYLAGPSGLEPATSDHTIAARLVELGEMSAAGSADRAASNQLYRSLGTAPSLDAEVSTRHLGGYTHLIVCSDGLWGQVAEGEIAGVLRDHVDPQTAADRLIEIANARGGPDNISVVVAQLPPDRFA